MRKLAILTLIVLGATALQAQTTPDAAAVAELKKLNAEVVGFYGAGNYQAAIKSGELAVKSAEKIFGAEHLETSLALRNLGFAQVSAKELKSAGKSLGRSYEIFKKLPVAEQKDTGGMAKTLETLGLIRLNLNEGSALELFEEALVWFEKAYGPESAESRYSMKALAEVLLRRRDYNRAADVNRRRLGILARTTSALSTEAQLALKQTQCSYRKADKEAEFGAVEAEYKKVFAENPRPPEGSPSFINAGIIGGKAEFLAKPVFPSEARGVVREAAVKVDVMIDEQGTVIFACAVSAPHKSLIESVENAAYSSKFRPVVLQGKPVVVSGILVYQFKSY